MISTFDSVALVVALVTGAVAISIGGWRSWENWRDWRDGQPPPSRESLLDGTTLFAGACVFYIALRFAALAGY